MTSASPQVDPESIGMCRAVWQAFRGKDIAYFPRVNAGAGWESLDTARVLADAVASLETLTPTGEDLDKVFDLARESLDEVKAQTEYQDGKATRVLTIITFVGALSGVLFGKFVDSYPLHAAWPPADHFGWFRFLMIAAAYLLFVGFALYAACGALVTFHAIRGRFRYPQASASGDTKSFLFFQSMLRVPPTQWAASYAAKGKLSPDLKLRYFKNYVSETYLVASKVADKVRFLEPAQKLQLASIRVLILWLVVVIMTFALFAPVDKGGGGNTPPPPSPASAPPAPPAPGGDTAAQGKPGEQETPAAALQPPSKPAVDPAAAAPAKR